MHVGKLMSYGEGDASVSGSILEANMLARRLAKMPARDPESTGQTFDDAFWCCLLGDTLFQRPAPVELGILYHFWEALGMRELSDEAKDQFRRDDDELGPWELVEEMEWTDAIYHCALMWNIHRAMCCTGWALTSTDAGELAMVPPWTVTGDWLGIFHGLLKQSVLTSLVEKGEDQRVLKSYR